MASDAERVLRALPNVPSGYEVLSRALSPRLAFARSGRVGCACASVHSAPAQRFHLPMHEAFQPRTSGQVTERRVA